MGMSQDSHPLVRNQGLGSGFVCQAFCAPARSWVITLQHPCFHSGVAAGGLSGCAQSVGLAFSRPGGNLTFMVFSQDMCKKMFRCSASHVFWVAFALTNVSLSTLSRLQLIQSQLGPVVSENLLLVGIGRILTMFYTIPNTAQTLNHGYLSQAPYA